MTKNMRQYLDALKAQGVPHQLYFHRAATAARRRTR